MMVIHKKSVLLQKVDDTMAVLHTHAIAGSLGGILTGLFAEPKLNRLFYGSPGKFVGLFYGFNMGQVRYGFRQLFLQLVGILFVVVLNIVSTSIICLLVQLIVPLRLSDEQLEIGDDAVHGEEAYSIWQKDDTQEVFVGSPILNAEVNKVARTGGQVEMA